MCVVLCGRPLWVRLPVLGVRLYSLLMTGWYTELGAALSKVSCVLRSVPWSVLWFALLILPSHALYLLCVSALLFPLLSSILLSFLRVPRRVLWSVLLVRVLLFRAVLLFVLPDCIKLFIFYLLLRYFMIGFGWILIKRSTPRNITY